MAEAAAAFFGERAKDYDGFICRLVPHYHDVNAMMVALAALPDDRPVRALDVGAGTGALAEHLLETYPQASLLAIDAAPEMIGVCRERLARFADRVTLTEGRFPGAEIGGGYDLILSSLIIHHLEAAEKKSGFQNLYDALNPGGSLIIRDYVIGATERINDRYEALWRQWVADQGQDDMSWFEEHREADRPSTAEDQVAWLAEIGFADTAIHWRHTIYTVFGGRKPDG